MPVNSLSSLRRGKELAGISSCSVTHFIVRTAPTFHAPPFRHPLCHAAVSDSSAVSRGAPILTNPTIIPSAWALHFSAHSSEEQAQHNTSAVTLAHLRRAVQGAFPPMKLVMLKSVSPPFSLQWTTGK